MLVVVNKCVTLWQINASDMTNILKNYHEQKAHEVMLYILGKEGTMSYYKLMKVMFCAERRNLLRWGDPLTALHYAARQHGPVPVRIYDEIATAKRGDGVVVQGGLRMQGEFDIRAERPANMDYLSVSDVEAIDAAISELHGKGWNEIEKESHDAVYKRLCDTTMVYTREDIAETAGATEAQLARIRMNERMESVLA